MGIGFAFEVALEDAPGASKLLVLEEETELCTLGLGLGGEGDWFLCADRSLIGGGMRDTGL